MLNYLFAKTISIILTTVVSIVSIFGFVPKAQIEQESLGATIPIIIALFETSLATKITSTSDAIVLTSGTDKDGNALNGTYGFVIDEGSASEEFIITTCVATACATTTRGVSVVTGNTEITALKKAHRRGASVKISNHPQLAILSRIMNGDESFPNNLTFKTFTESSSKLQYSSLPTITDDKDIISKKYADDLSYAGTPDGSLTIKGIFELSTLAELLAGTATGTTGAYLTAPTSMFATTTSASNLIPITDTDGKLQQGFLDLTEGFSFTGAIDFDGIPTMSTTTPSNDEDVSSKKYVDDTNNAMINKASAYLGSDQTATSTSSGLLVEIATETYDINTEFDTGTHLFTAKTAGYYLVIGKLRLNNSANIAGVIIKKNSTRVCKSTSGSGDTGYRGYLCSNIVQLDVGDTVGLYSYSSINTLTTANQGRENTFLTIHRLSD